MSPLLFVAVMEVVTWGVKEGLPWELLYADDLVLIAQSAEELREKVLKWKKCMEAKGLKINVEKTKVMRSGKGGGGVEDGKVAMCCIWEGCRNELYPMH